jgi:formate-nitrite transporter family protein
MTSTPHEIYERSADEGERRLSASFGAMAATGFLAGVTITFGIIALGIAHGLVVGAAGEHLAKLAGALAFGIGLVFAVVGRTDLFTENFLDPVAAALEDRPGATWPAVARMWGVILAFNLIGGIAFGLLVTIDGALPSPAPQALVTVADEFLARGAIASFVNAIAAGALLTLMTYLVQATESAGAKMAIAYLIGVLLAIGPFNHVVVTLLHLVMGWSFGADVTVGDLLGSLVISTAGNLLGGVLLITISQTVRAKS